MSIHVLTINIIASHEWRLYRDLRLRALRESPDAFGSTYAAEVTRTDVEWANRLATVDTRWQLPLIARVHTAPAGLAWGRIQESDPQVALLYQVWVTPEQRGLGIGTLLLKRSIDWAGRTGARRLQLDVTCGDSAASRLYRRHGFIPFGEAEPLRPGSSVMTQSMSLALRGTLDQRSISR